MQHVDQGARLLGPLNRKMRLKKLACRFETDRELVGSEVGTLEMFRRTKALKQSLVMRRKASKHVVCGITPDALQRSLLTNIGGGC